MKEEGQVLRVISLDPPGTQVIEDGFKLEKYPDHETVLRLSIVSILPVVNLTEVINFDEFCNNLYEPKRGDNSSPIFLKKEARIASGLHTSFARNVLCVTHEVKTNDDIVEHLSIRRATTLPETYAKFMTRDDYADSKEHIESFINEDDHAWFLYKQKNRTPHWNILNTQEESRFLVIAMLHLFNRTCAKFAWQTKTQTMKRVNQARVDFGFHARAKFNAPLRNAVSFINILNVATAFKEHQPFFSERKLQELGIYV